MEANTNFGFYCCISKEYATTGCR